MENKKLFLALFLVLGAGVGTSTTQAAIADAVVAWGDNEFGQTTVPLAAQIAVTAIAAGESHTLALKNDGTVVAWGDNALGQVTGLASVDPPYAAIALRVTLGGHVLSGVTAIAAGQYHTVALKNDGTVVAWGFNGSGQVAGIPPSNGMEGINVANPVTLGGFVVSGVMAVAAGAKHTVVLRNDGSVVAWGDNIYGQTNVPVAAQSGVTAIAAGQYHTLALKNDGSVVAWGFNGSGQVTGIPSSMPNPNAPNTSIATPVRLGGKILSGVTAIAAGEDHSVALRSDGSVIAWGDGSFGQTTVPAAAQSGVTAIAAGVVNTVALKSDGSLVVWGEVYDVFGYVPANLPAGLSGVTAIAAGGKHTVALVVPMAPGISSQRANQAVDEWQHASFTVTSTGYPLSYQWRKDGADLPGATAATYNLPFAHTNQAGNYTVVVHNILGSVTSAPPAVLSVNLFSPGAVVAWGDNRYDQTMVPVAAQSGVTAVAAGGGHTVALKVDGTVVAWGWNRSGQVTGLASPDDFSTAIANPVTFGGQVLSGVTAIAAGMDSTWALRSDGTVVAWGDTGISTTIANPVTLRGQILSGVTAIAAGFAMKSDGTVVVLGRDQTSIPVTARNGVTAIAVGWQGHDLIPGHDLALKNDGTLVAWGGNAFGEVTGIPSVPWTDPALANPVTLGGQVLREVTAIAAGAYFTCALKADGSLVLWGLNMDVPAGLSGVTAMAAGAAHTVALKNDGTVGAWRNNLYDFGVTDAPVGLSGVTAIAAGRGHTVVLLGGAVGLQARRSEEALVLSWPASATGFALQSTLSLASPVTWKDSTTPPAVIGRQFTVTNANSGSIKFYRLRKP